MLKRIRSMMGPAKDKVGNSTPDESASYNDAAEEHVRATIVARQPIFDVKSKIWGYELLFRDSTTPDAARIVDSTVATSTVISDGFSLVQPGLSEEQKVLINFPSELLQEQIPKVLPAAHCGVEILEDVIPTRELLLSLLQMKHEGYLLAVDDYIGQKELQLFLKIADVVKVDVLGRTPQEIARDVNHLRQFPTLLLAEKVEDQQMFALCKKLGFDLFQGFFFSRPELVQGKKLSASEAVKMRILAQLADDDFSVTEVGDVIRADVSLVYKLLKYLNSIHFALPSKVKSVEHGVALLGRRRLTQWLCVTVLSDLESVPMSRHVVSHSAQRAKFLEILGNGKTKVEPNSLFLLGLFSLLDTLLSIPLESLLEGMPLEEELVAALKGEDSDYLPWLKFLQHYERGEWEETMEYVRVLGLTDVEIAQAYEDSIMWANTFFS